MPGVTGDHIDRFVKALQASAGTQDLPQVQVPAQRLRPLTVVPADLDSDKSGRRKLISG